MSGTPAASQTLTSDQPWPGLASFTEEGAAFFHGRQQEARALLGLVQRSSCVTVFGLSGLGKTSLLQAGLFPELRRHGFLPVPVRLDWNADAPPPAAQLGEAMLRAAAAAGVELPAAEWRHAGDMWEFLHRVDVDFWDGRNRIVRPVLVMDQFEELFTHGTATEAARARRLELEACLEVLVENHCPESVRSRLESGAMSPLGFDFEKRVLRLVLALREDFMAPLDELRPRLPTLGRERLRLLPLSGTLATGALLRSGGHLLEEGIAERIVSFIAGRGASGRELPADPALWEIEPTLLSVVARELNLRRLAAGAARISGEMLRGTPEEILADFYQRSFEGLPSVVHDFVEEELLTTSGYRNSAAVEDALLMPGVSRAALDALVARRLLRYDDRSGIARVELTHDVLTGVAARSRDERHRREELERTRREKAEIAAREAETRAALSRARRRMAAMTVLAAVALAAMLAAFLQWRTASSARHAAEEARAASDKSRAAADSLRVAAEESRRVAEQSSMAAEKSRAAAEAARTEATEAQKRAESAEHVAREGETARRRQLSRSELAAAVEKRDQGDTQGSLGHLAQAMEADPANFSAAALAGALLFHHPDPPVLYTIRDEADLESTDLSADGTRLICSGRSRRVRWYRLEDVPVLEGERRLDEWCHSVDMTGDARIMTAGLANRTALVWLREKPEDARIFNHGALGMAEVDIVKVSDDGLRLAAWTRDGKAAVWDTADPAKPLVTLPPGDAGYKLEGLTFSSDGQWLAAICNDGHLRVWSASGADARYTWAPSSWVRPSDAVFVPGTHTLHIVTPASVRSSSLRTAEQAYTRHLTIDLDSLPAAAPPEARVDTVLTDTGTPVPDSGLPSLSAGGGGLAVFYGANEKVTVVQRLASALPLAQWRVRGRSRYPILASDGSRVVTIAGPLLQVWDLQRAPASDIRMARESTSRRLAFAVQRPLLVTDGSSDTIEVWEVGEKLERKISLEGPSSLDSLDISQDGSLIVSGDSKPGAIELWQLNAAATDATHFHLNVPAPVLRVVLSADAKLLAAGFDDGHAFVWRVEDILASQEAAPLHKFFHNRKRSVVAAAFSPDGRWLATGAGARAWVFDLQNPSTAPRTLMCNNNVSSLCWDADGRSLCLGIYRTDGVIWRVGGDGGVLELGDASLTQNAYQHVAASSRPGYVAAVYEGRHALLWDIRPGTPIPLHRWMVSSFKPGFSGKGDLLALSSTAKGENGLLLQRIFLPDQPPPAEFIELVRAAAAGTLAAEFRKPPDPQPAGDYAAWMSWYRSDPRRRPVWPGSATGQRQRILESLTADMSHSAAAEALRYYPDDPVSRAAAASFIRRPDKLDAALEKWRGETQAALTPLLQQPALALQAVSLLSNSEWGDLALPLLEASWEDDDQKTRAESYRKLNLFNLGRYGDFIALPLDESNARDQAARAYSLAKLNRPDEAVAVASALLQRFPSLSLIRRIRLGYALLIAARTEQALSALLPAGSEPTVDSLRRLCTALSDEEWKGVLLVTLHRLGKLPEAYTVFDSLVAGNSSWSTVDGEFSGNLARHLEDDLKKIRLAWQATTPPDFATAAQRVRAFVESGELALAVEAAEKFLGDNPGGADALSLAALTHARAGNSDKVRLRAQQGFDASPGTDALIRLAWAHLLAWLDPAEASRAVNLAAAAVPADQPEPAGLIAAARAVLARRQGDPAAAVAHYERMVELINTNTTPFWWPWTTAALEAVQDLGRRRAAPPAPARTPAAEANELPDHEPGR